MATSINHRRAKVPLAAALLLAVGVLLSVSCQPQTTSQTEQKRYLLKGTVVSANPEAKQIVVTGEEIPGFMEAMTMPYPVKDARILEGISFGDQINADVVVEGDQFWLEKIVVIKEEDSPAAGAFHRPQPSETARLFAHQSGRQAGAPARLLRLFHPAHIYLYTLSGQPSAVLQELVKSTAVTPS
ncbi:MAG: copper-binding protein [Acidobacteria bacterium]|nr:copper-binding protein [Acidobacteriota bacterium]